MENTPKTEWCRTGRAFTAPGRYGLTLAVLVVASLVPGIGLAQITDPDVTWTGFTFKPLEAAPDGTRPNAICNIPGLSDFRCDINPNYGASADDGTSFIQEKVSIGGINYYHLVVGQPEQGFAQEVLIRAGTSGVFFRQEGAERNVLSESGGGYCIPEQGMSIIQIPLCRQNNNSATPLGPFSISGNGSGNPEAVLIKQIMSDPAGGLTQEFLKAEFDKKPVISQNMNSAGVVNSFVLDMSAGGYKDVTPGKMTNLTNVEGVGQFDANDGFGGSNEGSGKFISGGRYTFSADAALGTLKKSDLIYGSGLLPFNYGTYTYYDDATDPTKGRAFDFNQANWGTPIDPAQNPASSLRGLPP